MLGNSNEIQIETSNAPANSVDWTLVTATTDATELKRYTASISNVPAEITDKTFATAEHDATNVKRNMAENLDASADDDRGFPQLKN